MTHTEALEYRFREPGLVARPIGAIGWGLFAEKEFQPGDVIYTLDLTDNARANVTPFRDAFDGCYERGITIIPGFVFCTTEHHPLWNSNHSCNANSGFVNWGRLDHHAMSVAAYPLIKPGDQITLEYSWITPSYDGAADGDPWSMAGCLCGEPNSPCTITDLRSSPP